MSLASFRQSCAVVALSVIMPACADPTAVGLCQSAGICDPSPALPAEEYLVLADGSPGSVATTTTVEQVLEPILERASGRPGSTIAIRVVGDDAEASREIVAVEIPEPPRRLRDPERHREQTVGELTEELLGQIGPALQASTDLRASAIAEALTLAAREPRRADERHVVLLTDYRQRTHPWLRLECRRRLPSERRWFRRLDRRGLLRPGSFDEHDHIQLLSHGLPSFARRRRCPTGIRRHDEWRSLWTAALERAGAVDVREEGRAPVFAEDESENDAQQEGTSR